MDKTFKDDLYLICTECDNKFVFTRYQQRESYQKHGSVDVPTLCFVCQVQQARMAHWATIQGVERDSAEEDSAVKPSSSTHMIEPSGEKDRLDDHYGEKLTGRIKWFNKQKGFGFIQLDDGSEVFIHHSDIANKRHKNLRRGKPVHFTVEKSNKGPQATHLTVLEETLEVSKAD